MTTMNDLKVAFDKQLEFQAMIGESNIPRDDPEMFAHHLLGLTTEVGEVAQSDKRWKRNGRNKHYDKKEKLDEISDCFIFIMNLLIYSDISLNEFYENTLRKIEVNKDRYLKYQMSEKENKK